MQKISLVVSEELADQRLDKALLKLQNEIPSRSFAANLINTGRVHVNGLVAKASVKLRLGDKIDLTIPSAQPTDLVPLPLKLDILFEDEDLLIVNKPAGLVVHPANGHQQDTLVNALIHHTTSLSLKNEIRPGIVHRIDRDTSGLLLIAKNDRSHDLLAQQFKNKSIRRTYYAVGIGNLSLQKGSFESFLARHPNHRKKFSSTKSPGVGKWAKTHYEVLKKKDCFYFLRLQLETGRTHQIRVHLSEAGCPIVGDILYGADKKTKSIRSDSLRTAVKSLSRFLLHAQEIGFIHPRTNEQLFFSCPWPTLDQNLIDQIFSL